MRPHPPARSRKSYLKFFIYLRPMKQQHVYKQQILRINTYLRNIADINLIETTPS